MAPEAIPVLVLLGNITVNAYQLAEDDLCRLLLTHRQIGEPIGKTKATAQKFCKEHEQELPPTVTAIVPDKPRPVALSSWTAALVYWRHQAQAGNATALALVEAAGNIAEHHLPIEMGVPVTSSDPPYPKDIETAIAALPQRDSLPNSEQLQRLDEGLNLISQWMVTAGVGAGAIASWKLNVLADRFPSLGGAAADAQQLLGQNDTASPTGMIASGGSTACF